MVSPHGLLLCILHRVDLFRHHRSDRGCHTLSTWRRCSPDRRYGGFRPIARAPRPAGSSNGGQQSGDVPRPGTKERYYHISVGLGIWCRLHLRLWRRSQFTFGLSIRLNAGPDVLSLDGVSVISLSTRLERGMAELVDRD